MITLPKLPYEFTALEPVIDAKTVEIHYTKHHQGYVNKINELIQGTEFEFLPLEEIIVKAPAGPIFNNAAQIWNHTFYWQGLRPAQEGNMPQGILLDDIVNTRGSRESFVEKFSASALGNFWSGWTWLVKDEAGALSIVNTSNAATPLTQWLIPMLTIDVREHAYYLGYQNRRVEYIANRWKIINWNAVV